MTTRVRFLLLLNKEGTTTSTVALFTLNQEINGATIVVFVRALFLYLPTIIKCLVYYIKPSPNSKQNWRCSLFMGTNPENIITQMKKKNKHTTCTGKAERQQPSHCFSIFPIWKTKVFYYLADRFAPLRSRMNPETNTVKPDRLLKPIPQAEPKWRSSPYPPPPPPSTPPPPLHPSAVPSVQWERWLCCNSIH